MKWRATRRLSGDGRRIKVSFGAWVSIHASSLGENPGGQGRRRDEVRSNDSTFPELLQRMDRRAAALDARVDGHAGPARGELDRLEQRHRDTDLALQGCLGRELERHDEEIRRNEHGVSLRAILIAASRTAGSRSPAVNGTSNRGWCVERRLRGLRLAADPSLLALLSERPVGDDPDVDAGQLPHHPREQRAAQDLDAAPLVRGAHEDIRGATLVGDPADGVYEVVAFLLEEMDAENAGEPPEGGELRRLLRRGLIARRTHPEGVDLEPSR